jgi:hypothetical protein
MREATLFDQKPTEVVMSTDLVVRHDVTPIEILQSAVDQGRDASQLEKLMDLQERWERNQAEKEFATAMHACQQDMPKVLRNAENAQTHSTYATLERVQESARPVYSKHGFSLSYGEADCPVASFKRTVCDVRHVGGACHRYHLDLPMDGVGPKGNAIGGMNAVQGCISTTSYGQRRLLCMIFNITLSGEDDDGQGAACIDPDQIAIINEWLETTSTDLDAFLKWVKAKSLNKMPAAKFDEAIAFFKRKQGQNR